MPNDPAPTDSNELEQAHKDVRADLADEADEARKAENAAKPLGFARRLLKQTMDDEVPDLAAGLAYRFLFAIFPFGIFLAALAAFVAGWIGVDDPTGQILGAVGDNLPSGVASELKPQLEAVLGQARPGLLSIGAIAALWAATGGVSALMKGMNKAYDVEETRNFFVKTGIALVLTILGTAGILIAFVTIVGSSVLTENAVQALGIGESAWGTVSLLRWPLVLLLVAVAVAVLFRFGPNVAVSFRWTFVGGLVFAVGWLLATVGFGLYVANFANYSNTYGALGGVIILMLWFYLTGVMLLLAAEVTSLLVKDHEPQRVEERRRELAESAARKVGRKAGAVAGEAKQTLGSDGSKDSAGGRGSNEGDRRREHGDGRPGTRRTRHRGAWRDRAVGAAGSAGGGSAGAASTPVLAALVVGAGAIAGAVVGLLTGRAADGR